MQPRAVVAVGPLSERQPDGAHSSTTHLPTSFLVFPCCSTPSPRPSPLLTGVEAQKLHLTRFLQDCATSTSSTHSVALLRQRSLHAIPHAKGGSQVSFCPSYPLAHLLSPSLASISTPIHFRASSPSARPSTSPAATFTRRAETSPLLPLLDSGSNAAAPQEAQLWYLTRNQRCPWSRRCTWPRTELRSARSACLPPS